MDYDITKIVSKLDNFLHCSSSHFGDGTFDIYGFYKPEGENMSVYVRVHKADENVYRFMIRNDVYNISRVEYVLFANLLMNISLKNKAQKDIDSMQNQTFLQRIFG